MTKYVLADLRKKAKDRGMKIEECGCSASPYTPAMTWLELTTIDYDEDKGTGHHVGQYVTFNGHYKRQPISLQAIYLGIWKILDDYATLEEHEAFSAAVPKEMRMLTEQFAKARLQ